MTDQSGWMSPGDQDLERRLEAYADARLTPSLASTTRMRSALMTAAHRQAALIEADATVGAAGETWAARANPPKRTFWQVWRRPLAAVFAGCLTLGILAGTAWSARPGGPLYAARLWTEMANLPADLMARAEAEAQRLQSRIDEAQEASSAGDPGGTEAALTAYSTIVVEAARGSQGDATARSTIEGTVELHVTVLIALVDSVPPPARAAAENALTQSTKMLQDLKSPGGAVQSGSTSKVVQGGRDTKGPKVDPPGTGDEPAAAEPGTTDQTTDQTGTSEQTGTNDESGSSGQTSKTDQGGTPSEPCPPVKPADKTSPPGNTEEAVQRQGGDHGAKPGAGNGNASAQGTGKHGHGSKCDDPPKPGSDQHKP